VSEEEWIIDMRGGWGRVVKENGGRVIANEKSDSRVTMTPLHQHHPFSISPTSTSPLTPLHSSPYSYFTRTITPTTPIYMIPSSPSSFPSTRFECPRVVC